MAIIAYLLFCMGCFTAFSICTKKFDGEDVSVGRAVLYLFMCAIPGLNLFFLIMALTHMTIETKFFSKKLF